MYMHEIRKKEAPNKRLSSFLSLSEAAWRQVGAGPLPGPGGREDSRDLRVLCFLRTCLGGSREAGYGVGVKGGWLAWPVG